MCVCVFWWRMQSACTALHALAARSCVYAHLPPWSVIGITIRHYHHHHHHHHHHRHLHSDGLPFSDPAWPVAYLNPLSPPPAFLSHSLSFEMVAVVRGKPQPQQTRCWCAFSFDRTATDCGRNCWLALFCRSLLAVRFGTTFQSIHTHTHTHTLAFDPVSCSCLCLFVLPLRCSWESF